MTAHEAEAPVRDADPGPLAIICGGGTLPFAVAEAAAAQGRRVVLFALRGIADAAGVERFPHRWIAVGQAGRFVRLARSEGCREVVLIGGLARPRLTQLRFDLTTVRLLPRLLHAFRGGDDHLLSALAGIFETHGFRLLGAHEVAPQILMPQGVLGRIHPNQRDHADIVRGLAILAAIGPFDIGQAVVVADGHCLAVEGPEGTDALLARIAEMRRNGRVPAPPGVGVLVKAPKPQQDRRIDLPAIGPRTVEGAVRAGLAGITVAAGEAIVAESERLVALADRGGLFVAGVGGDGTFD